MRELARRDAPVGNPRRGPLLLGRRLPADAHRLLPRHGRNRPLRRKPDVAHGRNAGPPVRRPQEHRRGRLRPRPLQLQNHEIHRSDRKGLGEILLGDRQRQRRPRPHRPPEGRTRLGQLPHHQGRTARREGLHPLRPDAPVRVQRPGRTHRPGEPSHGPLPDERRQGRGAAADLRRNAPPHDRRPHGGRPPAGDRPHPGQVSRKHLYRSQRRQILRLPLHAPELLRRQGPAGARLHVGRQRRKQTHRVAGRPRSDRRPGIGRNRRRADAAHVHRLRQGPHDRDVLPERTYLRARRHGHGQEDRKQPQPRIFGTASTARCASRTRSPTIFSKSRAPASPTAATNSSTTTPTTGPRGPRPLRSSISRPRRAPTTATRT